MLGKSTLLVAALFLGACHKEEPPSPTQQQSDQLNEADSMLNDLANEEGPEANAPSPSNQPK